MIAHHPSGGGGAGSGGDVVGPASSTDNNIAIFDGVTGKLLKDASVGSVNLTFGTGASPYHFTITSFGGATFSDLDNEGSWSWGTTTKAGKYTFKGNGTTTGKVVAGLNSSGATTWYIQDNGNAALGGGALTGNGLISVGVTGSATGSEAISIGYGCVSSNTSSVAMGTAATASGLASVAIGHTVTASASLTFASGYESSATGALSIAMGYQALASRPNQYAHGGGQFAAKGDNQTVEFPLSIKTTNNTPTTLMLDGAVPGTSRLTIPSGKLLSGILTVQGIKSDGTAMAMYVRQVSIKNVGGTTSLNGPAIPTAIGLDIEDNALTDITITADDTNDALQVNVTGITGETWRWNATFQGVEIAYGN